MHPSASSPNTTTTGLNFATTFSSLPSNTGSKDTIGSDNDSKTKSGYVYPIKDL